MSDFSFNLEDEGYAGFPEAEKIANRSKPTIWRWCNESLFPSPHRLKSPSGKSVFLGFRRSELREWVRDPAAWVEKQRGKAAA